MPPAPQAGSRVAAPLPSQTDLYMREQVAEKGRGERQAGLVFFIHILKNTRYFLLPESLHCSIQISSCQVCFNKTRRKLVLDLIRD